jgi:hypothetical protein
MMGFDVVGCSEKTDQAGVLLPEASVTTGKQVLLCVSINCTLNHVFKSTPHLQL